MSAGGRFGLVVFDCDGVLVDSERISVRVGAQLMAELGWSVSEEEFARRFVGCSGEEYLRGVQAGLGRRLEPGWDEPYRERFETAFAAELAPVPGITDVLDALDAAGVPSCVASNSGHGYLRRVLTRTGLADRFAGQVFSAQDVARGKPAPDVYLHAARRMDRAPADCAVVEDSPYGVTAAVAAGMTCFAYSGGVTPAERLTGRGATLVPAMAALVPLLTGERRQG